jgi:hypothetical protein
MVIQFLDLGSYSKQNKIPTQVPHELEQDSLQVKGLLPYPRAAPQLARRACLQGALLFLRDLDHLAPLPHRMDVSGSTSGLYSAP